MQLTFDEAVENHRKMWNWIADETERRMQIVSKYDYFKENKIEYDIISDCYCCEYEFQQQEENRGSCIACPINWGKKRCYDLDTAYKKWWHIYWHTDDWKSAAKYAREIANLPERRELINC